MKPTYIYAVAALAALLAASSGHAQQTADQKKASAKQTSSGTPKYSADPAKFIVMYEESRKNSELRYDAADATNSSRTGIKVDSGSSLILRIKKELITKDTALNQLLITAQLASGGKTTAIPVAGYSEIGKDQTTGGTQNAVAIQTASQISALMDNLYWSARDILDQLVPGERQKLENSLQQSPKAGQNPENPLQIAQLTIPTTFSPKSVATTFANMPEAKSIPQFFTDPHNKAVAELLGTDIFGLDSGTLNAIAATFPAKVDTLLSPSASDSDKTAAAQFLVTRVWMIYRDIQLDYQAFKNGRFPDCQPIANNATFADYEDARTECLIDSLKGHIVPGQIDLGTAGAQDGDTLTITVESKAIDGNGTSAVLNLNVDIKNYGYRVATSPSLMFIRRIGVTEADKTTQNLNPVRFSPAPGVTYGVTFLPRNPIWSALAPGIGANLSFLNYDDPTDFNVSTGKFTNTSAVNVQFGAGVEVSLFNNMLQATYGWNLNAPQKRAYWGLGFGFFDVAKYFANKFGK